MTETSGTVSYDVKVICPHCGKSLALNQYPYTDDGEYDLGEDELGLVLFGTTSKPAKWENFEIEYKCCGCKKDFILTALEI